MEYTNRLEELIQRYENTLFRAALAMLGDSFGAEDAVQDTFLRYLEKRPVFRDEGHEKGWLLTVCANLCKSRLRAAKRHPETELTEFYPAPEGDDGTVTAAVMALPEDQRAVIHLFYYEGYSTGEIASILGRRPGTVRSQLSRARETLRRTLKGVEL